MSRRLPPEWVERAKLAPRYALEFYVPIRQAKEQFADVLAVSPNTCRLGKLGRSEEAIASRPLGMKRSCSSLASQALRIALGVTVRGALSDGCPR